VSHDAIVPGLRRDLGAIRAPELVALPHLTCDVRPSSRLWHDLFFHPEGERGSARRRRAEAAKAICATCPVIKECREQSLTVREPYGVWGGLSEDERAAILARRGNRRAEAAG
jgi:WhiB family redox-sensing transcriptional regulator